MKLVETRFSAGTDEEVGWVLLGPEFPETDVESACKGSTGVEVSVECIGIGILPDAEVPAELTVLLKEADILYIGGAALPSEEDIVRLR